jgi:molybdopterin molybdotransferase
MPASSQPPVTAQAEEVIALVRQHTRLLAAERVALDTAFGRVLREDVVAPEDQPAFDRSAFDGYAIRLDDPGRQFCVVDRLRAGDWKPRSIKTGEAVQIATGAALPDYGLQVIPKEDVQTDGQVIEVIRRTADRHVRSRGEDAHRGQVLVASGTVLGGGALALLASAGHTQPLVSQLPRVLHLATGNEIVAPDQQPGLGQIRDSNSILVRSFFRSWGIAPAWGHASEDETAGSAEFERLRSDEKPYDLLVVSGGASVGEHDFTRRWLEGLGFTIRLAKTNTRPGRPLLFGSHDAAVAFGLPGNPLSHFTCLNLFVRAALDVLVGGPPTAEFQSAILTVDWEDEPDPRETLWPARLTANGEGRGLIPLPWRSSGDLTPLAVANALWRIPPSSQRYAKGSVVSCLAICP